MRKKIYRLLWSSITISLIVKIVLVLIAVLCLGVLFYHMGLLTSIFSGTEKTITINKILIDFSFSYLAAFIFYLLVSYFPYKIKYFRMRPFINNKKAKITSKFVNCAIYIMPPSTEIGSLPKKDELASYLECTELYAVLTDNIILLGTDIRSYWQTQCKDIKFDIQELLSFKEYLTDRELKTLGELQNCEFFSNISYFLPLNDNPEYRKRIANNLWTAIQIAQKL